MQFFDITNLEKSSQNLKTKSIVQVPKSPKKKNQLNYMEMNNFKFDWICLNEEEFEIMKDENPKVDSFTIQDQFYWFQNEHTHFAYPLTIEHGNFIESLKKHKIDECKRHNLLCWMGYVMGSYESASNETYFLAISILDKFLQQTNFVLTNQELLAIGICCISLASKCKDVFPLTSQQLIELSSDKMDELMLTKCQFNILQTLQYQVEVPNYFKIFDYIMRDLEYRYYKYISSDIIQNSLVSIKLKAIYKCSLLLLKFVSQYYDSTIFHQSAISYGSIFYTIKRMELLQLSIPNDLINVLQQIQVDQKIINTEIVLKYIYRLCQNGMSKKQQQYFRQANFKY
ncbi:unnamed protein product [Paramecium primaurelia]|uniref:Cyclin N-terminal domain-containing protein n=1 Tax=Paramecium primaurelia TaxID=5886 RepID=A0A8S1PPZ8_PARPR|nr:unnamed protein product [Paramecium primaurelia]